MKKTTEKESAAARTSAQWSDILRQVDHTILKQDAHWEDVKRICDEALRWKCASVCIPPSFVREAKRYVEEELSICTVIGFPNGYSASVVKAFEADNAIKDGADEIDMVINVCDVKDGRFDLVADELSCIRAVTKGRIFKVIIECCLLTDEEKICLCQLVTECGADFIKTSTGFSKGGATVEDVRLLRDNVGKGVGVKAAGGISDFETAQAMIEAGASRIGASRLVGLMEGEDAVGR